MHKRNEDPFRTQSSAASLKLGLRKTEQAMLLAPAITRSYRESANCTICGVFSAPDWRATSLPDWNRIIVGMAVMLKGEGELGLA